MTSPWFGLVGEGEENAEPAPPALPRRREPQADSHSTRPHETPAYAGEHEPKTLHPTEKTGLLCRRTPASKDAPAMFSSIRKMGEPAPKARAVSDKLRNGQATKGITRNGQHVGRQIVSSRCCLAIVLKPQRRKLVPHIPEAFLVLKILGQLSHS